MKIKNIYLILAFGLVLRIIMLGSQSVWLDEAFSIYHAQKPAYEVIMLDDPSPPLYYLVLHNWTGIFGISEFWARFPSVIFGVASILLIYLIGKRMHDEKTGLFAALILSVSSINVYFSQEARAYSLLFMLSLASMHFYLCKSRKTAYVITSTLMIYTHIFGFLVLLVQGIHTLLNKELRKMIIPFASIIILFIPWMIRLPSIISMGNHSWIPEPSLYYLGNLGYSLVSGMIHSVPGFLLFGIAVFMLARKQSSLSLLWLTIPVLIPFVFSFFFTPVFYPRYVMFVSLPLILMLARADKKIVYAFVMISFITLSVQQFSVLKEPWRDIVNDIKAETIGIVMDYEAQPFMYYYDRSCFYEDLFECARKKGVYPVKTFEGLKQFDAIIYSRVKHHEQKDLFEGFVKDMPVTKYYYLIPSRDIRFFFQERYDTYSEVSVYRSKAVHMGGGYLL